MDNSIVEDNFQADLEKADLLIEIKSDIKKTKIYQTIDFPDFKLVGKRKKTDVRLQVILDACDPAGKKILDLGCSNGLFSFELAKRGARVFGVDKNETVLSLNRKIAKYYGWDAQFDEGFLDLEYFRALPKYDCVLFLSVLHHTFNHSFVQPIDVCRETIKLLSTKTDLLVFEFGQSGEPFSWSRKLALMEPNPKEWILQNLFSDSDFTSIEVIEPPAFKYGKLSKIRERIWKFHKRSSVLKPGFNLRKILSHLLVYLFIYDPRDTRYIFIGRK